MKESQSLFLATRGLRYHVRRWPAASGSSDAPKMFLLHGWMDVSASFQFVVDALERDWDVYAPDWRGYGLTEWGRSDSYWFPDYLADLDKILEHFVPQGAANLVGHSLGGNVAVLYAGIRPQRVARLVNLEGFGMAPTRPEQAPKRYARWLNELHEPPMLRPYKDFAALAERLRAGNPRLTREKADFLARHWGREAGDAVVLRGDPAHKIVNPLLYRIEEVQACWREVSAPVLWVDGAESDTLKRIGLSEAQHAERRNSFKNLKHVTVKSAGHMLHHDQPEEVARLIEGFIA
ncbi:MAG TPA: alpha/beta hydrolase [Burkholderiales bacterium]